MRLISRISPGLLSAMTIKMVAGVGSMTTRATAAILFFVLALAYAMSGFAQDGKQRDCGLSLRSGNGA